VILCYSIGESAFSSDYYALQSQLTIAMGLLDQTKINIVLSMKARIEWISDDIESIPKYMFLRSLLLLATLNIQKAQFKIALALLNFCNDITHSYYHTELGSMHESLIIILKARLHLYLCDYNKANEYVTNAEDIRQRCFKLSGSNESPQAARKAQEILDNSFAILDPIDVPKHPLLAQCLLMHGDVSRASGEFFTTRMPMLEPFDNHTV
jgi:hypothetical protein